MLPHVQTQIDRVLTVDQVAMMMPGRNMELTLRFGVAPASSSGNTLSYLLDCFNGRNGVPNFRTYEQRITVRGEFHRVTRSTKSSQGRKLKTSPHDTHFGELALLSSDCIRRLKDSALSLCSCLSWSILVYLGLLKCYCTSLHICVGSQPFTA